MQLKNFLKAVLKIYEDCGEFKFTTPYHFLLLLIIYVVAVIVVNLEDRDLSTVLAFPYVILCFGWSIKLFDKKLPKGVQDLLLGAAKDEGIVGIIISFLAVTFAIFAPVVIGGLLLSLPSVLFKFF